jgi:hypothetical protein
MMISYSCARLAAKKIETNQLANSADALRKRGKAHATESCVDSTRAQRKGQQTLSAFGQPSANLNAFQDASRATRHRYGLQAATSAIYGARAFVRQL